MCVPPLSLGCPLALAGMPLLVRLFTPPLARHATMCPVMNASVARPSSAAASSAVLVLRRQSASCGARAAGDAGDEDGGDDDDGDEDAICSSDCSATERREGKEGRREGE